MRPSSCFQARSWFLRSYGAKLSQLPSCTATTDILLDILICWLAVQPASSMPPKVDVWAPYLEEPNSDLLQRFSLVELVEWSPFWLQLCMI
jgi:hypothetical protein